MKKPRLTAKTARLLLDLSVYAEAEAEELSSLGTPDQERYAERIKVAADWVRRLAQWKLAQGGAE